MGVIRVAIVTENPSWSFCKVFSTFGAGIMCTVTVAEELQKQQE